MKNQLTLKVDNVREVKGDMFHITLVDPYGRDLPEMLPGQFVEVAVTHANVLLNRPFSIFNYTPDKLELLVKRLGRASEALGNYSRGDELRVIAPLGRGFTIPDSPMDVLLIGGGVGVAPLYYLARTLNSRGIKPTLIYGERTAPDSRICKMLSKVSKLEICTDDGSCGRHGFVTGHPALTEMCYDMVQVCGPKPMMAAVYNIVKVRGLEAEFSLENKMACGLGACLCCVENTTTGNRCVCTDGPVFRKEELAW